MDDSSPRDAAPDEPAPAETSSGESSSPEPISSERFSGEHDHELPHVEVSTEDLPYGSGPLEHGPRQWGHFLITLVGVLLVDQVTKAWAVSELSDYRVVDSIGSLQLRLTYNTGAAFSVGSGKGIGPLVTVLAIAVIGYLIWSPTTRRASGAIAVGLVSGGALGNLADRAFREGPGFMQGGVVDFIDLQWWPVFNVADAAVVIGAVALAVIAIRHPD